MLFDEDFHDFSELWCGNMENRDLVNAVEKLEIYSPVVEDISLDDNVLCQAVEKIERVSFTFIVSIFVL